MQLKTFFFLLLIITGIVVRGQDVHENFERAAYYKVLATGNMDAINSQLNLVKKSSVPEKEAYEGTLLMKKAGLTPLPVNKLSYFKAGHTKLEASIAKDSQNVEFRFLRLLIQENAPGIVNYRKNLEEDSKFVRDAFKTLPEVVRHAVMDYSKRSKVLHPADFNFVKE